VKHQSGINAGKGHQDDRRDRAGGRIFPAKVLLFGEYSLIYGSMALSMPFGHFNAGFAFRAGEGKDGRDNGNNGNNGNGGNGYSCPGSGRSNALLRDFTSWLRELSGAQISQSLDIDSFESDLKKGLFLASTIPEGYGLGSSGALCAAVYHRYGMNPHGSGRPSYRDNLAALKKLFSEMENYFHGTSSGLDPLNCYLGSPVLVNTEGVVKMADIPGPDSGNRFSVILADTGNPRATGPLVKLFAEKAREKRFMDQVKGTMIPLVNNCINTMLKPDPEAFSPALGELSRFQMRHMKQMIPERFHEIWNRGLASGDYLLKLCGAGGGGYFLGFTENIEKTRGIFSAAGIGTIPVIP
jgi:mevalonate kinase